MQTWSPPREERNRGDGTAEARPVAGLLNPPGCKPRPGSEFSRAIEAAVGPTTFSINADELMWAFFVAHPRRA